MAWIAGDRYLDITEHRQKVTLASNGFCQPDQQIVLETPTLFLSSFNILFFFSQNLKTPQLIVLLDQVTTTPLNYVHHFIQINGNINVTHYFGKVKDNQSDQFHCKGRLRSLPLKE